MPVNANKTFSATVIEYLRHSFPKDCGLAYVYFDYQEHATQNITSVFINLLKQLVDCFGEQPLPEELAQRLDKARANPASTMDTRNVTQLILLCAQHFSKTFLIFDAIDECEDSTARWKLLSFLTMLSQSRGHIKGLVTCRPYISIPSLNSDNVVHIQAHKSDLEAYVWEKTEHTGYTDELRNDIVVKIVENADGL